MQITAERVDRGWGLRCKGGSASPSLERSGHNPRPLSASSDVVDVPFKSGSAGAVSRNTNLGCYTTAGVCSRCSPGGLSASPPPSPPQLFRDAWAGCCCCRRRLPAPPRATEPGPPAQAGPDCPRLPRAA